MYHMVSMAEEAVESGGVDASRKAGLQAALSKHIPQMATELDSVKRIRGSEFVDPWVTRDLQAKFSGISVRTFPVRDAVLDLTYNMVDIRATIEANPGLFGTTAEKQAFASWVKNYGNSASAGGGNDYTDASKSHYDVLNTMTAASTEIEGCLFHPYISK